MRIGILTVSTRVAARSMEDRGGPAIASSLPPSWEVIRQEVVSDDLEHIAATLSRWADEDHLDVIFTTGGTGLGPDDVTPEATERIADRIVPGIGEAMRAAGRAQLPAATLSRATAGIRGETLIINLPGSPKGAAEGVAVVLPVLEHAVHTMHGGHH